MTRIGLDRTEYLESQRLLFPLVKQVPEDTYPKPAELAAVEVRRRGYHVSSPESLKFLAKGDDPIIDLPREEPRRHPRWTPEAIDKACLYFEEAQRYGPEAAVCFYFDLPYIQWIRALSSAYMEAVNAFGLPAMLCLGEQPQDHFFTFHAERDWAGNGPRLWFSLRDDVKKAIEQTAKGKKPWQQKAGK